MMKYKYILKSQLSLVSEFLERDGKWKIHPDWVYCEYNYGGTRDRLFDTPEDMMHHFLLRLDDVSIFVINDIVH